MRESCGDDRFELIGKAKARLLEATNIEMRPDEMAVIDNILFRCWQMGWLDQLRDANTRWHDLFGTPERAARTLSEMWPCTVYAHLKCGKCVLNGACANRDSLDALLEWLRGESK